jgi:uncharacterized protein
VTLRGIGFALVALAAARLGAAEVIPAAPAAHFNDYASVVSPQTAAMLDQKLGQFERDTSNQVVVAIYPKMESDSSVEDYTVRVAQSWHAGLKGRDNGAVLFIFTQTHQMYLQVGYGLEGVIPDATAKRIISDEISPYFRRADFDGGVTAGVNAILAATRGEYKGSGHTVADARGGQHAPPGLAIGIFLFTVLILSYVRRQASVYQGSGHSGFGMAMLAGMMLGGGGRGGFGGGGGGGFGGGGGGFSGGGGGFGGGGAGGSW